MKITVNKCPDTGELFECDQEFAKHRRRLLRAQTAEKRAKSLKQARKARLLELKSQVLDPADIPQWILDNQEELMSLYNDKERRWPSDKFYKTDQFEKIEFGKLRYSDLTSNSHSCPENGVTNWCARNPDLPKGYPGWQGRVSGKLTREPKHMSSYPCSNLLEFVGVYTGTGGGGNESWGYQCEIFLDDWPSLQPFWQDMKNDILVNEIISSGPRLSVSAATC